MLTDLSGRSHDTPIEVPLHKKYILDNGEYAFLLVDMDGMAEKLSPAFKLSEESTNLGENEIIPSSMINSGSGMEVVRYIPANSSYQFPLRDEQDGGTSINDSFLAAVDEVYEPYLAELFSAVEAWEDWDGMDVKNIYKELLVGNLAKIMVNAYFSVPWVELSEECGSQKEAYEWVVKQTFSDFGEQALNKTKEDLVTLVQSEYSESE